jgi:hypothetical protein
MANTKPTTSMTPTEIVALSDRLVARADSILNTLPQQTADLQTAAKILKALIKAGVIKENIKLD